MGTNSKIILVLFLVSVSTISFTCRRLICSDSISYSFNIGMSASPDNDSIMNGDTIWLECNASARMTDLFSGDTINFGNAKNLGTVVTLLRFLPGNNVNGAIDNFNLNLIKGSEAGTTNPVSNKTYVFSAESNMYKFKLAIISKDTGRFALTISNATNVYRQGDNCTKAVFEIDFQNTNQHFYLLQSWRPDLILDNLGRPKVYYFKVY